MNTTIAPSRANAPAGDLLIGAEAIRSFLVELGMPPDTDIYYLRRSRRWPIGSTAEGTGGGKLIASKRRLVAHIEKIARGTRSTARQSSAGI